MKIVPFNVVPSLPERLQPLKALAENVWFSWHMDCLKLFQQVDRGLWEECEHNPVRMLGMLEQAKIDELLKDEGFLDQLDRVSRSFERYMANTSSYSFHLEKPVDYKVAYLSAEYGLTECLPLYSGGLGILSGDHLKSASDLRVPLVAVGLLYKEGYFHQYLNSEGLQTERYPDNDFHTMPIKQLFNDKGEPVSVDVTVDGRRVVVYVWQVQVGRVPLYLLDTNNHHNSHHDRQITGKLYGGDKEMRLQQEIVLGIGGVRALGALGLRPAVFHMNEGHSAFAALERVRQLIKKRSLTFDAASEFVMASSVFTTHTPVPAGNDVFAADLMQRYFQSFADEMGVPFARLLALGRVNPEDRNEPFCMTVLALHYAAWCNGVSKIHARVSQNMWTGLWPELPTKEVPIKPLTNGVHIPSWISIELSSLYDRYLGPRWAEDPDNEKVWERALAIPDTELWRTHERRRERLVAFARRKLVNYLQRTGASRSEIEQAWGTLNPSALTIGFARRFATYKRGVLIFSDLDRLSRILNDADRPVQILFAGKAHPADNNGKEFIRRIVQISRESRFQNRIVFLEDYDIHLARYLVQGVDVWLNNPLRPLEACGTSGMKAAANGALNLSVLDGWWDEAYQPNNGFAIGSGEEYTDERYAAEVESRAIYDLLEKEVVPLFYRRGADDLPHEWIDRMKNGLKSICPVFNTHRMVEDYMEYFYHESANIALRLKAEDYAGAKELASWKERVAQQWNDVRVLDISLDAGTKVAVNSKVTLHARVSLGSLSPDELNVEAYYGKLDSEGKIQESSMVALFAKEHRDGTAVFEGALHAQRAGRFGASVRIMPKHALNVNPLHSGIIRWG